MLSPHNDHAYAAAGFCGMLEGVPGSDEQSWRDRLAPLVPPGGYEPDMRSGKTKYSSICRFKGLAARVVVLTDIDRLETEHDRDLFYIGATRATQRLVVLARASLKGPLEAAGSTSG